MCFPHRLTRQQLPRTQGFPHACQLSHLPQFNARRLQSRLTCRRCPPGEPRLESLPRLGGSCLSPDSQAPRCHLRSPLRSLRWLRSGLFHFGEFPQVLTGKTALCLHTYELCLRTIRLSDCFDFPWIFSPVSILDKRRK